MIFFTHKTVEDVATRFEKLKEQNYKEIDLAKVITEYNYEITSSNYVAFAFENIEEYYAFEVDRNSLN